jgi:hypothetical protein
MHNLHLVVVKAETGEDAMSDVESYMDDWGTENNWRTMCGAVSQDNEVVMGDAQGAYPPEENLNSIENINKMVRGWMEATYYGDEGRKTLMKVETGTMKLDKITSLTWYSIGKYAEYMQEKLNNPSAGKFNVLTDSFYAGQYDENGITQIEEDNEGKKWVVFVDMHS